MSLAPVRPVLWCLVVTGSILAGWNLVGLKDTRPDERARALAVASTESKSAGAGPADPTARPGFYESTLRTRPSVVAMTELGRIVFADRSLSASGQVSCATCHDPGHAYGPANARSVQRAGTGGKSDGLRAAPSLRYVYNVPAFTEHFHEGEDDSVDQGPTGGHTWDGRAATIHDQARLPLLSAEEMGNPDAAAVVAKVEKAPYAGRFRELFGADLFVDGEHAFKVVLLVLEVFQQSPVDFYPYSSKYDAYLRRETALSDAERRGLALFNDPVKGNCALCHPSAIREGAFPAFSDWGYIALGVPRNGALRANQDPRWFDLGLCGPLRRDFAAQAEKCGLFRTPSLRNVAQRGALFHNGSVHRLEDAVAFYAERDTRPERWYPSGPTGTTMKFDDLPEQYRGNVDMEAPFGRERGSRPALSQREIADVVAFLKTLSDGWHAPAPGTQLRNGVRAPHRF